MLYTWNKTRLEVGSIICACNPEEISLLLFVIQSSIPVLLYYLLFTIPDVHRILSNKVLLVIIYTIYLVIRSMPASILKYTNGSTNRLQF